MISALLPENVTNYEFLTEKDFYQKKDILEKAAAMKRFEKFAFRQRNKSTN